MAAYSFEETLASCSVPKSLLQELEDYVRKTATALAVDEARESFSFIINDEYGAETLESVRDYQRATFPNDTQAVSLYYRSRGAGALLEKLEIRFSTKRYSSQLVVQTAGPSARETALGIVTEIRRRLSEHRNLNSIFYGPLDFSSTAAFAIATTLFFTLNIKRGAWGTLISFGIPVAIMGLGISWELIKRTSPYCEIETQKIQQIAKWRHWLLTGLLGVVIFGSLSKVIWS